MSGIAEARGRGAVAASLLAVLLIGGYSAASIGGLEGSTAVFALQAAVLILGFWFPAMRVASPAGVLRTWRSLLPWILGWTLVWDLATAGVMGGRDLFQEWWIVYPSGVAFFVALLLLHAFIVARWSRAGSPGEP